MSIDDSQQNEELAWQKRILCSDETCIGVIGPDGRCKECGQPYQGDLDQDATDPHLDPDEELLEAEDPELVAVVENPDREENTISDEDWEKRILCSDESCIGVIDSDGRCKECGKPMQD
jgi:hypothetical protein